MKFIIVLSVVFFMAVTAMPSNQKKVKRPKQNGKADDSTDEPASTDLPAPSDGHPKNHGHGKNAGGKGKADHGKHSQNYEMLANYRQLNKNPPENQTPPISSKDTNNHKSDQPKQASRDPSAVHGHNGNKKQ